MPTNTICTYARIEYCFWINVNVNVWHTYWAPLNPVTEALHAVACSEFNFSLYWLIDWLIDWCTLFWYESTEVYYGVIPGLNFFWQLLYHFLHYFWLGFEGQSLFYFTSIIHVPIYSFSSWLYNSYHGFWCATCFSLTICLASICTLAFVQDISFV